MIGPAVVVVVAIGAGVGLAVRRRSRMRRAKGPSTNTVAIEPLRVLVGGAAAGGGANVVAFRPQVESQKQVLRETVTKGFAPSMLRVDAEELIGGGGLVKKASETPPYQVPVTFEEM